MNNMQETNVDFCMLKVDLYTDCYIYVVCTNSITACTTYTLELCTYLHGTMYWYLTSSSSFILLLMSPDKVKKREIEMKPNQAYETVILPSHSRSATQVYTEPCPAYEVVVHTHH